MAKIYTSEQVIKILETIYDAEIKDAAYYRAVIQKAIEAIKQLET